MESRRTRLSKQITTLSDDEKDNIILELVDYAIDAEYVCFWDDTIAPYYDGDGERLDGVERTEE